MARNARAMKEFSTAHGRRCARLCIMVAIGVCPRAIRHCSCLGPRMTIALVLLGLLDSRDRPS
jgi:hypothetical protein